MKSLILGIMACLVVACSTPTVVKPSHGLTGGMKDADWNVSNCWVQPPHEELWYPCPDRSNLEGYLSHGH